MKIFRKLAITVALVLVFSLVLPDVAPALRGTMQAEAAVKMNVRSLELEEGEMYTLKIKGSSKAFNWISSDTSVAKVKRSKKYKNRGTVTAVSAGTAVIIATRGSKSYTCTVTVVSEDEGTYYAPTATPVPQVTATPAPTKGADTNPTRKLCTHCNGTGLSGGVICPYCYGAGYVSADSSGTPAAAPALVGGGGIVATDAAGNYVSFGIESPYSGNTFYSEANTMKVCVKDYDRWGTYTTTDLSYSVSGLDTDFYVYLTEVHNADKFAGIHLKSMKAGDIYDSRHFEGSYSDYIMVFNDEWFASSSAGGISSMDSSDADRFIDMYFECFSKNDKTSSVYFFLELMGDDGLIHEIDGLRVISVNDSTPTAAPKATATPAPAYASTPTPAPTAAPTAVPTVAPTAAPTPTQGGSATLTKTICTHCGGTGRDTCNFCSGMGKQKCTSCSGRGQYLCPNCYGTGRIKNSYGVDGFSICNGCYGSGYKKCTAYGCVGGYKSCIYCSGKGYKDCIYCLGTGMSF